eukprot:2810891-Amphidinium_carterae.1
MGAILVTLPTGPGLPDRSARASLAYRAACKRYVRSSVNPQYKPKPHFSPTRGALMLLVDNGMEPKRC